MLPAFCRDAVFYFTFNGNQIKTFVRHYLANSGELKCRSSIEHDAFKTAALRIANRDLKREGYARG